MKKNSAAEAVLETNRLTFDPEQVRHLEQFLDQVDQLATLGVLPESSFRLEPALGRTIINSANSLPVYNRTGPRRL